MLMMMMIVIVIAIAMIMLVGVKTEPIVACACKRMLFVWWSNGFCVQRATDCSCRFVPPSTIVVLSDDNHAWGAHFFR